MSKSQPYDEKELLIRLKEGDQTAFNRLVDQYSPIIYGHLLSWLKNVPLAEEITQDILLGVWHRRSALKDVTNLPGYIFTMTRNRAYNAFREKLYATVSPPEDLLDSALETPAATLEYNQLYTAILQGIDKMPTRRKQVFLLSRMEHKSYEEIAQLLGISKSTVKQHIIEALVFLRSYLKQESGIVISALFIFFQ